MALQFTRNANVYVQLTDSVGAHVAAWKLSVLDGFSFTQSINSSEITINEAGTTSRRARLLFNDSLAPVEWSMSTYARPFKELTPSPDECRMPEDVLWAMLLGADSHTSSVFSNSAVSGVNGTINALTGGDSAPVNTFDFSASNVSSFSDRWNIYFSFEETGNTQVYKLDSAVVNSLTMDFDIDGIATLQWSGFAKSISDEGTTVPNDLSSPIESGLTDTDNFIRNRISTVDLVRTDKLIGSMGADETAFTLSTYSHTGTSTTITASGVDLTSDISQGDLVQGTNIPTGTTVSSISFSTDTTIELSAAPTNAITGDILFGTVNRDVYNIVLTGGSFSIENNISYLTPEELGVVNAPLANITGARAISGTLNCYLDNDQTNSKSGELFADLVGDTATVRNVFDMAINVGGETTATPRVELKLPTAHLEVPTINVEDLLTLEINFHGQVSSGNVDNTNEATVIYKA
jgi:hypothetical protein